MYKTRIEKILLSENISLSVIKETESEAGRYALIKIGLFGMSGYAICAMGEDYAVESVGYSHADAERLYDLAVREGVSPTHLFDVVSDARRGEFE